MKEFRYDVLTLHIVVIILSTRGEIHVNAYELADQVEMWGEDLLALNMKGGIPVVQGAKMLRQQAGELEYYKVRDSSHIKIIKEQADRIAELEKELHIYKNKYKYNELVKFVQNSVAEEIKQ